MLIHPSALIDPSAELAEGVEVQAFTIIEKDVRIGAGTVIGPHCVIGAGTVLGPHNHCFSGAQLGVPPQDLKHLVGTEGRTIIGEGNIFREFVTVSSGTVYADDDHDRATRIGDYGLYMASTHVAHDCLVGDRVIMANSSALAGHVTIQDGAIIGGLTGIHQFCVVGRMAFIGGMSRINKDVLPYMITEGHPARCYGPNTVGLERSGFHSEAIKRIRTIYKLLYRSGLNTHQALDAIEQQVEDSEERRVLLDFVRHSPRGISK
jgi:UDP-N-acetylglucosamine acyltransferase